MPNPQGINPLNPQPAYGAVKRSTELQKSAPMSGAPVATPAVNAPSTAQERATGGRVAAPNATQAPAPPDYQQELAATWAEIAANPNASPLVREIAQRAMRMAGLGA